MLFITFFAYDIAIIVHFYTCIFLVRDFIYLVKLGNNGRVHTKWFYPTLVVIRLMLWLCFVFVGLYVKVCAMCLVGR